MCNFNLHSDFLEVSYELHIKMKFLVSLLLGDVNNFLIPPRTLPNLDQQICLISGYIYVKFAQFEICFRIFRVREIGY